MFQFEEREIATLQRLGFKRWTKGPHDRLYISTDRLARLCGFDPVGLYDEKTFVDLRAGLVVSKSQRLFDAAVALVADVIAGKYDEDEDDDEPYIPSASAGDYSPNCPWKAPGMRISDFVRL